jgi:phosphosulfolactate synthase
MVDSLGKRGMEGIYPMVVPGRSDPPRTSGLTMVIDMGSGIAATRDLLEYAGRYIDILKISSGTAAIYPERILKEKLELCGSCGIVTEAGGSHFEVAFWKKAVDAYFRQLKRIGFAAVEIADGHLPLDPSARVDCIQRAKDIGLKVMTEVGKKMPSENIRAPGIVEMMEKDLEAGADHVIIEGKASGMDVGIFDARGEIVEEELDEIVGGAPDLNRVIWEAPLRPQAQALILRFGPNVNLGNISPQEAFPLELMRNGLMLMPLIEAYRREMSGKGGHP